MGGPRPGTSPALANPTGVAGQSEQRLADKPRSRYLFSVIRERLRGHGGAVLDFALGRHAEPPPPRLLDVVRDRPEWSCVRGSPEDVEAFAVAASDVLARVYGVPCAPSSILPVPGGRTAMAAVVYSLVEPGDGVLVTEPGYPAFARLATVARARVASATLDPTRGFDPDVDSLGPGRPGRLRVLGLNYPNNPTGCLPCPSALATYARLASPDTVWFNDATYGPLTYDERPFSLLGTGAEAAVELHSMAKLFPLGPLSSAFLAGDPDTIGTIRDYSEFAWAPISALQLRIGCLCLEDRERFAGLRDEMRSRLGRLREVLGGLGFEALPTAGGIYLLCRAPAVVGGRRVGGAREAADALLAEHGLAVVPFETPPHGYLRFSALYLEQDLEGLAALGRGGPLVWPA